MTIIGPDKDIWGKRVQDVGAYKGDGVNNCKWCGCPKKEPYKRYAEIEWKPRYEKWLEETKA